jgi:superfamily I DNA and/or RNA helicase
MTDLKIQKQIWNTFIDAQEQIIKLRAIPFSILPENTKIVGDKIIITVNENHKKEIFEDILCDKFNLDSASFSIDKGYFIQKSEITNSILIDERNRIAELGAKSFLKFYPNPVIDGLISKTLSPFDELCNLLEDEGVDFSIDRNSKIEIGIANLKLIDKKLENLHGLNVNIPDTAGIILKIKPNPVYFLQQKYKDVEFRYSAVGRRHAIETINGYFNKQVLDELHDEIGLKLIGYNYTFFIKENALSLIPDDNSDIVLPSFNTTNSSFNFRTNLNVDINEKDLEKRLQLGYEEEKQDFNLKYTRLLKFFNQHFGEGNFSFESSFIYSFDNYMFNQRYLSGENVNDEQFWKSVHSHFTEDENIAFSDSIDTISFDFNWREQNIEDVIIEKLKVCPIIDVAYFKDHKCKIDFNFKNITIDEIENSLKDVFPSLETIRNEKKGELTFRQFYTEPSQLYRIRDILKSELALLDSNIFSFQLFEIPEGYEKYICEENQELKFEEESSTLNELRGSSFATHGKEFGNLFRVKYPELFFNISDEGKDSIIQLFENETVDTISPNLTGDIEKINRLKKTTNSIINGNGLKNPNLQNFIFDSSQAKKITDYEFHINPLSDTFQDLNNHLLNTKVNESQKQAIIKTLLAEDLAIIQGPPGTGKSTAIAEIIWQHIRLANSSEKKQESNNERILLTSETNLAVDNAIDRIVNNTHNLVKPIRIADESKLEMEGRQFSIEIMKKWVEGIDNNENAEENEDDSLPQKLILTNWLENIERRAFTTDSYAIPDNIKILWKNYLDNPNSFLRQNVYDCYMKNCNVIGATCSSIGERSSTGKRTGFYYSYQEIFGNKPLEFTTVIQDEASKATPAELSLPLVYGKKAIVIGDHRQLPPLLDKEDFISTLEFVVNQCQDKSDKLKIKRLLKYIKTNFKEIEVSHFERLFEHIDVSLKGIFNLQFRMHPDINDVIKQFYINDGGLNCGLINPIDLGVDDADMKNPASRFHGINIENVVSPNNHVIWINTNSPEILDGTSRINPGEVEAINWVLTEFEKSKSFADYQDFWVNPEDKQIGLISFYFKQIKLLRNLRNTHKSIPIRISTVDRFQGMERNIIIVSMVRSNRIANDKNQKPDIDIFGDLGFPPQKDLGFAKSPNRLNVALSRARRLLIIVGNSELYMQNPTYKNVFESIKNNPNGRIINYPVI